MAAWSPSEEAAITPYAADVVPFGPELSTTVRTASPERTFWEKATILHQEANRPEGKAVPRRYSRHYYDMYRLGHSFVLGRASRSPASSSRSSGSKRSSTARRGPSWPTRGPARSGSPLQRAGSTSWQPITPR